jgi:hypothetical protein
MIKPCEPLLSEEIIERVKKLNAPLLLDGVKAAKLDIANDGCMDVSINPVDRGMTVVGTALLSKRAMVIISRFMLLPTASLGMGM